MGEKMTEYKHEYIIMGKSNCTYCTMAVAVLIEENVSFSYQLYDGESGKDVVIEKVKQLTNNTVSPKTFPQIFHNVNGKLHYVGGCGDLHTYLDHINYITASQYELDFKV